MKEKLTNKYFRLSQEIDNIWFDLPDEVKRYIDLLENESIINNDFIFDLWQLLVNEAETIKTSDVRELLRAKVVQDNNNIKTFKRRLKDG